MIYFSWIWAGREPRGGLEAGREPREDWKLEESQGRTGSWKRA